MFRRGLGIQLVSELSNAMAPVKNVMTSVWTAEQAAAAFVTASAAEKGADCIPDTSMISNVDLSLTVTLQSFV